MDKPNTTHSSVTIRSNTPTDTEAAHDLFVDLEPDAAHAEAVKAGEGSNANIANYPHQLSLRVSSSH